MFVDLFDDVENTQLMLGVRPYFRQDLGIQIRAIGHHDQGQEAVLLEIAQEAPHMILIIGAHHGEGHRNVAERIGCQQQGAMAKVDFIDTECSRELLQSPLAILGHIDLTDLPVQTVVKEALGQLQMKVAPQSFLKALHAHLVVEQTIENGFANSIGVLRSRLNPFNLRAEGLAAGATSAVFSDSQFDEKDFSVRKIADLTRMRLFEPATPTALRAGKGRRCTLSFDHANARTNSIHACVLSGVS
jgi:hypothetical protein